MRPSPGERKDLLDLFDGLRVADVRDGMDWNMMHGFGSMSRDMRPLFRTRACGIARTYRYRPFTGPVPKMTPEEYTEWVAWYYREICTFPWETGAEPGDFIVIEQTSTSGGIVGSYNGLSAFRHGARGIAMNGSAVRDTDELILQKVPVWSQGISQDMVQARIQYDTQDIPVMVGGVTVSPGDVIVADGDGVIVVPQKMARDVAKYARRELTNDKVGRRKLYDQMGWQPDATVA